MRNRSIDRTWATETLKTIVAKELIVAERSRDKIPYTTVDGRFDDWSDRIWWWTNGFRAGQMWQLYAACTGGLEGSSPLDVSGADCTIFRKIAESTEQKLDGSLHDYGAMDHDSGFKWLTASYPNYVLFANQPSLNRLLLAASNLAGRYNPAAHLIRAWNDDGDGSKAGWAIIDCMMNLPLLYRASELTHDPRFKQIAMLHADRAMEAFVREDGSVRHIVVFDPEDGHLIEDLGGQGMQKGSTWTRGQAWALYGFTLSYLHTHKTEYYDTAIRIADYFVSHIPESGLIPCDFCQLDICDYEDTTAATIAACGLLELSGCGSNDYFYSAAVDLLRAVVEQRVDWSEETDNLTTHCTAAYNDKDHNFAIIYGDYFLTEALCNLAGTGICIW